MSWLLPPLFRRLIAVLLLVLDLGQEPASALPLSALADADNDTITEICTEESFWCGPSADRQNICDTAQSKQSTGSVDAGAPPSPAPTVCGERTRVARAAIAPVAQSKSDVILESADQTVAVLSRARDISPAPSVDRDPSLVALITIRLLI